MSLRRAFAIAAGLALAAGATSAYVGAQATAGSERPAAFGFARIATGFSDPVFVTAPRTEPNRLYVVEKTGRVILLVRGRRRAQPRCEVGQGDRPVRRQRDRDQEQGATPLAHQVVEMEQRALRRTV